MTDEENPLVSRTCLFKRFPTDFVGLKVRSYAATSSALSPKRESSFFTPSARKVGDKC